MPLLKTQNEKRLALLLAVSLSVFAIAAGGGAFLRYRAFLTNDLAQVESQRLEAESWLAQGDLWKERLRWLDSHQPKLVEPRQDSLEFLQMIESSAGKAGVEITSKSFQEPQPAPGSQWIGLPIQLEASGSSAAVLTWLHELENTKNFILVSSLSLKADEKPSLVSCTMELMRCYQAVPGGLVQ